MLKGTQVVKNIREQANKIAQDLCNGKSSFELKPEDIKLLLYIRAMGYGKLELTITEGSPSNIMRVEEKVDLRKEITFLTEEE